MLFRVACAFSSSARGRCTQESYLALLIGGFVLSCGDLATECTQYSERNAGFVKEGFQLLELLATKRFCDAGAAVLGVIKT